MPGNETEQRIAVRAFSGVDIETDPAFLPDDILQAAQNLVPQLTFLLQKRYGTTLAPNLSIPLSGDSFPWAQPRVDVMRWTQQMNGTPVLFFVVTTVGDGVTTASGDRLYSAVGSPTPTVTEIFNFGVGNGSAGWQPTSGGRYGMAVLGGYCYVGNGINPIVAALIETPTTLSVIEPIGNFSIAATPHVTASALITGSTTELLPGVYSFRWGYLDTSSVASIAQWRALSNTDTITVTSDKPVLMFTGPSNADVAAATDPNSLPMPLPPIDAIHTCHLFLSPPGLPIEYARDQGMIEVENGTVTVDQFNVQGGLTPLRGAAYTGRYLLRHASSLWLAGNQAAGQTSRLYQTNTIVPGLEQQLYNYGDFFPALATSLIGGYDGDIITGIAVSGGGQNKDVASAPVVIFKQAAIYVWFGNMTDDPSAQLVQVSDRIGCVAPQTICSTPDGIYFLGPDSVYLLDNGFKEPQDVGLPIRPAILGIPQARLQYATATYHRQFYKLAITPPGTALNTQQWWLDLRPVMEAQSGPKWWGPHTITPATTMAVAMLHPDERERLYLAREIPSSESPAIVTICLADQASVYTDVVRYQVDAPVVARLRTGGLVEDDPFGWKLWKMVRLITQPQRDSAIIVNAYVDGGGITMRPTMDQNAEMGSWDGHPMDNNVIHANSGGGIWNVSLWNQALWGARQFVEGWSILDPSEPLIRSRSCSIELIHADPSGLLVRDLEVTFDAIARRAPGSP
jgi:hypothetical protein